jgi:hypothetical protein
MQFGGLIGEITLEGPAVPALWPAFWLGQWTHIGKGTAFGLGGDRVVPATSGGVDGGRDRKLANTDGDDFSAQTLPLK